jgi:hypothetical protein
MFVIDFVVPVGQRPMQSVVAPKGPLAMHACVKPHQAYRQRVGLVSCLSLRLQQIVNPVSLCQWQYGLHGEEAAAQALFDEIRTVVAELDRLSAPFQETIEMRLATAESERAQLGECLVDLRNRLANSEASLRIAGDQISSLTNAVENLNARISSMLASRCWQPDEAAEEENFTIEAQSYKMDLNMASNSTASPGRRGLVALAGDLICSTGSLMFSSNR